MTLALLLATLLATTPAIDPGQSSRPPQRGAGGLLKIDATFYEMASATGGDFYFWAPGEFAGSNLRLPIQDEKVVLDYGTLAGRRSVAIPVESGARVLTVFAGAQRKDRAVLVRPDGSIVAAGTDAVALQTFRHMLIATVRDPLPGPWKLEFDGAGRYSFSAHVRPADRASAPQFVEFEFSEVGGRPGHEGWFPIRRELRAGERIHCEATLAGHVSDVRFVFVARDGTPLAHPELARDPEYRDHHAGDCVIPPRPFRVVVTGRDENGLPFRRSERGLHTPK
jgi:hypothetical protein